MSPKITKANIKIVEKKFSDTAYSLTQERNDFFLPQVLDYVRERKWINLRPEYQRRLVWDTKKRSLFIESLLLNIPVPPLFLYEHELNRYEVMDGQQRLNAVAEFYEDAFALRGLERWKELNGLKYSDLPDNLKRGLDRRRLSTTVLLFEENSKTETNREDIRKIVFERLNTGGQSLNAQELRNCIYSGTFNNLLISLSSDALFRKIWEITKESLSPTPHDELDNIPEDHSLYRRMTDCQIVLRFFTFRNSALIKGSVRSMLDNCMEKYKDAPEKQISELKNIFQSRLHLAHEIFGENTFRHENENGKWILSQPLFDGMMVALDRLWENKSKLIKHRSEVSKELSRLLKIKRQYKIIIGKPNTAKAVSKRLNLITSAFKKAGNI